MSETIQDVTFESFNLIPQVLKALQDVGYETPSPIQAQAIPPILEGRDILGMAQTGTGKTAAFALPLLSRVDIQNTNTQILVLAPTRELAIQVAEAFQSFAHHMKGFHVLPIYGGQEYGGQIRALKRGAQVVVGTPGRVMDHMRKGTLKLDNLQALVLDEADEMLRMGFIDDVEWVLEQTPQDRQIALFSATMPKEVHKIASKHLNNPVEVIIKQKTGTASTISQSYWLVSGLHKLDALTRILEATEFDGMIIFVRTKTATIELAEKLEARGYAAAALNGDIAQNHRERIVDQLKKGKIDILIATDVVARGLDVERITHVVNYDIPYDTESYVHRIGRTGRAGRSGNAILFVAPRERRLLQQIERATNKKIDMLTLPSTQDINDQRVEKFKARITDALEQEGLEFYQQMIEDLQQSSNVPALEIAAALAKLAQGDAPFFLEDKPIRQASFRDDDRGSRGARDFGRDRPARGRGERGDRTERAPRRPRVDGPPESGMKRYRINVGFANGVKPGNIIGAIANEANIDGASIRQLNIQDGFSLVDLPADLSKAQLATLKKTWICGQPADLTEVRDTAATPGARPKLSRKPAGAPRTKRSMGSV
ncbi:DEAD/DEAH box helicase [Thiomicrospira cyclica]|uniref:ATP-dependent RNA helicase DeaD n=1 Tax=Thiomicrospira cyclica (strain DSM 14477 / JCM 11371 / ALM1) TaxID=717773 RepID=F6DA85_THICA|nr:DEAD/DEAH box helicase [Thiomicrospira cyclica]AEG32216.1 DEAD/DEAH box helicase domain protein [Thiomicrospira cyclica ALM1]